MLILLLRLKPTFLCFSLPGSSTSTSAQHSLMDFLKLDMNRKVRRFGDLGLGSVPTPLLLRSVLFLVVFIVVVTIDVVPFPGAVQIRFDFHSAGDHWHCHTNSAGRRVQDFQNHRESSGEAKLRLTPYILCVVCCCHVVFTLP